MFEEIYDNVLSALTSSGFINWHFGNEYLTTTPLCATCACMDCKRIKKLPSNLKYKTFNHGFLHYTPSYNIVDLNEL